MKYDKKTLEWVKIPWSNYDWWVLAMAESPIERSMLAKPKTGFWGWPNYMYYVS